jgi:hypothetical protein
MRWPFKIMGCLLLLGFLSMCVGIATKKTIPLTPEQITNNQLSQDADDAKIRAKEFVEVSLKSPSSAEWPSYNEFKVARATNETNDFIKDTWQVMGYVDAKNSYGVALRTNWLVTVKKTNTGWDLVKFSIL